MPDEANAAYNSLVLTGCSSALLCREMGQADHQSSAAWPYRMTSLMYLLALQLELERRLRALLTKEKEKAEEEASLAMGMCIGTSMLP